MNLSIIRRGVGYYPASLLRLPVPVLVPVSITGTWVLVTAYVLVPVRVHRRLGCRSCRRWSSDGHSLPATWSLVPLPIPGASLRVTRLPLPLPNSVPERSDSSGYWRAVAGFQLKVRSASTGAHGIKLLINWAIGLHKENDLSIIL